jgi:hypothetical protein
MLGCVPALSLDVVVWSCGGVVERWVWSVCRGVCVLCFVSPVPAGDLSDGSAVSQDPSPREAGEGTLRASLL